MEFKKSTLKRQTALKLIDLRKQLNYSKKEMAAYFGITVGAYYKNENGNFLPGIKSLHRLSTDHDISMDWFIFDKGPMKFTEKSKMEALEKELQAAREKVQELEKEKESLEESRKELEKEMEEKGAGLEITPEVKELLEYMARIPLLYHGVLVYFQEFKLEKRELVEASIAQDQKNEVKKEVGRKIKK